MTRRLLLILLVFLSASFAMGQQLDERKFDLYTSANGLSNSTVTGITQDSTGYIWIATSFGLNRFNGSRFVQFHSNNDSFSLAAEALSGLTWLGKNKLGATTSGLHIINTRTSESRNLFVPYHRLKYQYKFNMIERAIGDDKDNVFVLSRSGFYHYDKNYRLVSRFDFYDESEVQVSHFYYGRELLRLDNKRLLIVSIAGLYVYDIERQAFKRMEAADCPLMAEFLNYPAVSYSFFQHKQDGIFVFKVESDSLIYINVRENKKTVSRAPLNPLKTEFAWRSRVTQVSDTLFYITGHTSGFYKMRFYPESGAMKLYPEKYFSSQLCNALLVDREGNLWVATNKGVFRQNPLKSLMELGALPPAMEDSFPNTRLDDVVVLGDKIYAASRSRAGMLIFDRKTLQFRQQVMFGEKSDYRNNIPALAIVDSNTVLVGTGADLMLFDTRTHKQTKLTPPHWRPTHWTNDLYRDRKGNIWIGAYNTYRYEPRSGKIHLVPNHTELLRTTVAIEEDHEGNMWMTGHGITRYNARLDSVDMLLDSFPYIKMPDKQVNTMVVDRRNTLWFNSANNGLASYDLKTRTFRHFTRSHGLPDDNVASMTLIGDHLWMACNTGLACMDLRTHRIVTFGKEDGFPDMPVMTGARFFFDTSRNHLYLGVSGTLVRFNPFDILKRKSPPHVFIENLLINGSQNSYLPGQNVTTSWQSNDIRITIGTINFYDGNSQRFAYRILKKDSDITPWVQMGSQPSFSISSLSPGTYRVQVKCFSPSNRWTEQAKEMVITVTPPLWKEEWFLVIMGVLAFAAIYLLIQWRTGLARKKEMEKTHIEMLKADHYKSQYELEQISNFFSSSLAGKNSEEEVLWDVAQNLIGRMNYVDCMIYLWNEDKTKMVQKAAFGPKGKPEFISAQVFDVLPGQGIVGHVMETKQPVLVHDTRKDPRYRVDDQYRLSEVCVPIIHNDELLGIIDSEHSLANYFCERDIKILTTIAALIGNKLKQIESEKSLDANRKELATINEQLAEARLSALQAQMNPHFVFNALNSIKRMILDGDNEKASRYLSKFALMIRMTLNHSKEIFVTLDENIEYLRTYLEMEQLRFDESFAYSIQTSDNIEAAETPIPSMMIQPLVENAIWHGLMQADANKKILIGFAQHDNKITCTVEDNGIGIRQSEKLKVKNKSPHHSMGLENLQKRIKIMNEKYDMGCSLVITDLNESGKNGNGTRVVLQFNLINI